MKRISGTLLMNISAVLLCVIIAITAGVLIRRGRNTGGERPTAAQNYDAVYNAVNAAANLKYGALGISLYARNSGNVTEEAGSDLASADGTSYSKTNTQTEGVDEADKVKTDGRYIYVLTNLGGTAHIKLADTAGGLKQTGEITEDAIYASDMYLADNRLVLLGTDTDGSNRCRICIWDISKPEKPVKLRDIYQSGEYTDTRLIGNKLYVISSYYPNTAEMEKSKPETYVPAITCGDTKGAVAADSIYIGGESESPSYTVIASYELSSGELISTKSLLGSVGTVYASTESIIITSVYDGEKTGVTRLSLSDGRIELAAVGTLDGKLLNQFATDEYKSYCRFVITKYSGGEPLASLIVCDGDLKVIGKTDDVARGERVYSVRFMGDTAYFVTFRETDPLFSVDLSTPAEPKIIGALKIPGFSDFLYPYGDGRLLGVGREADESGLISGLKLSLFDISNPAGVTESAKTVIAADYSEANYNHKATLADCEKNLIALPIGKNELHIYSLADDGSGFALRARLSLNVRSELVRGLYINDLFYAVTDSEITVLTLDAFEITEKLVFEQ